MEKLKVVRVGDEEIEFDNGSILQSNHDGDCCEHHWLEFKSVELDDFNGLEFDLTVDSFFTRIEGFGIALNPINGHPVRIPGYGANNGYYSDHIDLLVVDKGGQIVKQYDITECQSY